MTPAESFERVRPHLAAAGVTRVADITGLDRIGIPTFISVRPAARTLAVDSGKGTTADHARASAVYESIERHVAETAEVPWLRGSVHEMRGDAHETNLPRVRGSALATDVPYRWAWARDVNDGGRPVAVPLAAVRLLAGDELPLGQCVWASTSNGLSASTDYDRAVFQALCEVIERDACACHQWAGLSIAQQDAEASNAWMATKCIDPESNEEISGLLAKIHAAGCEVRCFNFSMTDTQLPTFQCFIYEPGNPEAGLFKGYGAHPDPVVALRRAITEAVQARCVIVAGARDDIDSEAFARTRGEGVANIVKLLHAMEPRHYSDVVDVREGWQDLAQRLADVGFPRVLVYDFGELYGAHVVRVIVPGLAGYWTPQAPVDDRMQGFAEGVGQNLRN